MVARKYAKILRIALVFLICATLPAGRAMAVETLTFERMWPALHQPWRFIHPQDVAVDDADHIYIADSGSHSVQKFTSDGQLISRWTDTGKEGEEKLQPAGLAIESNRYVYIADSANHCIHKFTTNGVLVARWRKQTEKDDQIWIPMDVAVDPRGYVYVAEVKAKAVLTRLPAWPLA
jgi:DNA-binding beta-propeller fold protein YncE